MESLQSDGQNDNHTQDKHIDGEDKKLDTNDTKSDMQPTVNYRKNELQECDIDLIVLHVGTGTNVEYVMRWYGQTPANDTFEPPESLSQHLISR